MHLQSFSYVLYNESVETMEHMLLYCDFAKAYRNLVRLTVPQCQGQFQILEAFKTRVNVPFLHGGHHNSLLEYLEKQPYFQG